MRRPTASELDASWNVLDRVRSTHRAKESWAAEELRAVIEWAGEHGVKVPVETQDGTQQVSHPGPRGTEGVLFLAGRGARGVAEFAVTDLAAATGRSERAARFYLAEALELADRLPRLYARVLEETLSVAGHARSRG